TYCVNSNVADSACSATAYLSGVKANKGTVGVGAGVSRGDCEAQRRGDHSVTGLMDWAQREGKGTAASYAHSAERTWEADTDMNKVGLKCTDIATQLVNGRVGSNIDGHYGYRSDGVDLIHQWLQKKKSLGGNPYYAYNRKDLLNLDVNKYTSVLGLFSPDHMPYHLEAGEDDPTLAEMTVKAIHMLSKNKEGFFLFVEALDETAELAKAVEAALRLVDPVNTLVVVTNPRRLTLSICMIED
ncbi:Alkaline phosphatase, partial [Operophtera brumata]